MSAAEIIEQFKALPPEERAVVTKFVVEHDDSWIPEDFKKSMEDLKAGRVFDMETVMSGAVPLRYGAEDIEKDNRISNALSRQHIPR